MTILDDLAALTPTQYRILRVAFQQDGASIVAHWDVCIYNSNGKELAILHPTSQPNTDLRKALISWYQNSKNQFANATGLVEYIGDV